jgi:superfamily II DNA or RNA helicase
VSGLTSVEDEVGEALRRCLNAYRANPELVEEHFGIEQSIAESGYDRRQVFELVQNGADAILEEEDRPSDAVRRIVVVLTATHLYCANQGAPIDVDGVRAILGSYRSRKRGNEIGRFGVGFKSVLGVCDAPEVMSSTGSFRFDPNESRRLIGELTPAMTKIPLLRLAFPLDRSAVERDDAVVAELSEWATTVVRLPITRGHEWLGEHLASFPPEFILFSPHVSDLVLDDRVSGTRRTISARDHEGAVELTVDGESARWRLFRHDVKIPVELRQHAGELQDREVLPLAWAVPEVRTAQRGAFWAFFPMQNDTTLRGILNAPWKTNSDRQTVLEGDFNRHLIEQAAWLVLSNLESLQEADDPARFLDFLPGRGREASTWADRVLTEAIWTMSPNFRTLPDQSGALVRPRQLHVHPAELPEQALAIWGATLGRPTNWLHHSVEANRDRHARVERIIQAASVQADTVDEWLNVLFGDDESRWPVASAAAIRIALSLVGSSSKFDHRKYPMILTEDGAFAYAEPDSAWIRSEHTPRAVDEYTFVHADLLAIEGVEEALLALGIRAISPESELRAIFRYDLKALDADGWDHLWHLMGTLDDGLVARAIAEYKVIGDLLAKSLAGTFVRFMALLVPGPIVPIDGDRDREVALDTEYHAANMTLLTSLGIRAAPEYVAVSPDGWPDYGIYLAEQREEFVKRPEMKGRQPQRHLIQVRHAGWVGPLDALPRLSDVGRARFTEAVLVHADRLAEWVFHHPNDSYGSYSGPNPSVWTLRRHGQFRTSLGPRSATASLHPTLAEFSDVLPIADIPVMIADQLRLPQELEAVPRSIWTSSLKDADGDPRRVGAWLVARLRGGHALPTNLPTRCTGKLEDIPFDEFAVLLPEHDAASVEGHPFVLVSTPAEASQLVAHGLREGSALIESTVERLGEKDPIPIGEIFPNLTFEDLQVVFCDSIAVRSRTGRGSVTRPETSRVEGSTLYVVGDPQDFERLASLSLQALGRSTDPVAIEELVANATAHDGAREAVRIRDLPTVEEKLLAAVGHEQLRRNLPRPLLETLERDSQLTDVDIARLALAVHGVGVLQAYRSVLEGRGFAPPQSFAGGSAAIRFVDDLGLPVEYAGFQSERRESVAVVEGRPILPPLHEFQDEAAERIRGLVRLKTKNRGLLALPTGAGKTRVTIEALVRAMVLDDLASPILWIAETSELCEQAVQAWAQAWRALGPDEQLHIGRLWSSNSVAQVEDHRQVVVATMAKLDAAVIGSAGYSWLSEAAAVVIDEAHRATSPQYTRVLDWLGLGRSRTRCPLVGLTATPFRGTSETETDRLVKRFFGNRLDSFEDEDPYVVLQGMGVLSGVEHRLLDGVDVVLTADELEYLTTTRRLPPGVETRLGENTDRNTAILESIQGLPSDWPILLFATSVAHAETMAGLLSYKGVAARSISAETPRNVRRHYIDEFRSGGSIRVLTNYGVLTEGFDAPAVRAVYVTRPTYSPNVYLQMIGRGLRGPKNGGKETCLIVNVEDNLTQYGPNLAFRDFEHLWTERDEDAD